jgi:hypothetical protein
MYSEFTTRNLAVLLKNISLGFMLPKTFTRLRGHIHHDAVRILSPVLSGRFLVEKLNNYLMIIPRNSSSDIFNIVNRERERKKKNFISYGHSYNFYLRTNEK